MKRAPISVVMAAVAAVLLVGCQVGGSGGSAAGDKPTDAGAVPSMTTAPTLPATTAPIVSEASGAALSNCRRPGLTVSVGGHDAGLGHRSVVLLFTNTGSTACKLHGYPSVAVLDAAGKQVTQAAQTPSGYMGGLAAGRPLPTVTLQLGLPASAMVEALASTADGSPCAYQNIVVTAPDDTSPTRLPWDSNDGCSALRVHPVVPGTSGYAAG